MLHKWQTQDSSQQFILRASSLWIQTLALVGRKCRRFEKISLTPPEIDNPEALAKYYRLLLSISRIITAVVLARGPHNEQTIENAKAFLIDNRPLVVATFKRQARIGVSFDDAGVDIEELVELFTLLIEMTDFLDVSRIAFHSLVYEANVRFSMMKSEIPKRRGRLEFSRDS